MITLPTSKIPATCQDPKNLIIFSKPKIGKSTACASLPNALCIDLENGGYDYIDAPKITAKTVNDIKEICKEVKNAGCPYKFIVLDTITRLEDMVKPLALKLYKSTKAGSTYDGADIIDAPNGSGYSFVRKAIEMVIDMVSQCAPNIILICHTKDAAIANSEITVKTMDLLGKSSRVLASKSDAIGYLCRDENSNTILSFNTNDMFTECGARPEHLRNKEVVLGEMDTDGNIQFKWERIYPSLNE